MVPSHHTLALSTNYQATEKLGLNAGVTSNLAKDRWDWPFGGRSAAVAADNAVDPDGNASIGAYNTADINNEIESYSDLSYEQYQLTLGGTHNFTEAFSMKASATYDTFDAEEEYVYGDEDGDMISGYAGLGWVF